MFTRTMLGQVFTILCFATTAAAQVPAKESQSSARITAGATLMGAASVDDFDQHVDRAFGAGVNLSYAIDKAGRVAMRVDAEWLNHGLETRDVRLLTPL